MSITHAECQRNWRQNNPVLRQEQAKRYYARLRRWALNNRKRWTKREVAMVLERKLSDREIAKTIKRSVLAIQAKRCACRK